MPLWLSRSAGPPHPSSSHASSSTTAVSRWEQLTRLSVSDSSLLRAPFAAHHASGGASVEVVRSRPTQVHSGAIRENFYTCVHQNSAVPRNVRRHSAANDLSFFSPVFCTKQAEPDLTSRNEPTDIIDTLANNFELENAAASGAEAGPSALRGAHDWQSTPLRSPAPLTFPTCASACMALHQKRAACLREVHS
jgi:hypothetical protein